MKTILTLEDVAEEESVHYKLELEIIFLSECLGGLGSGKG